MSTPRSSHGLKHPMRPMRPLDADISNEIIPDNTCIVPNNNTYICKHCFSGPFSWEVCMVTQFEDTRQHNSTCFRVLQFLSDQGISQAQYQCKYCNGGPFNYPRAACRVRTHVDASKHQQDCPRLMVFYAKKAQATETNEKSFNNNNFKNTNK